MGNYKSKNPNADATQEQRIYPQPTGYQIKTRPPTMEGNTWKQNIQLKIRQEEIADQSMPAARRKCYEPTMDYIACTQREGLFWLVFNCQEQFFYVAECQERQYYIEMDKRRRNMKRNPQKWWRDLYSEDGEVGRQKQMQFGDMTMWDSVKMTFLGQSSVEEKRYYYGRPQWKSEAQKQQ